MARILISLVGAQPMPTYNMIKYAKANKVLLIYSNETQKNKDKIKNEFSDNQDMFINVAPLDPVNNEIIKTTVQSYYETYKNDEVLVDISSGTKPWAYYFSMIFDDLPNAKILYIDQNNFVRNMKTMECQKVDFDMFAQFRLRNNPLKTYRRFSEYTLQDFDAAEKIESIRSEFIGEFTELTNLNRAEQNQFDNQQRGVRKNRNSVINWDKDGKAEINLVTTKKNKTFKLESPYLLSLLFNAGWFEFKVARILSKWSQAKEIYMNCKFHVDPKMNNPKLLKYPKNEVDIIINTGDKLLFVECKTDIAKSTDIDKFNSVVESYGGKGSKALFVCLNSFKETDIQKIKDYNMLSFSLKQSGLNYEYDLLALLDKNIKRIQQ